MTLKQQIITEVSGWAGVTIYFRDDWQCDYFEVAGKCFAFWGTNKADEEILNIKATPEKNEQLRDQYPFIIPGYYSNKAHWSSILLQKSSFSFDDYLTLLRDSYSLVVDKLPKKVQLSLGK